MITPYEGQRAHVVAVMLRNGTMRQELYKEIEVRGACVCVLGGARSGGAGGEEWGGRLGWGPTPVQGGTLRLHLCGSGAWGLGLGWPQMRALMCPFGTQHTRTNNAKP